MLEQRAWTQAQRPYHMEGLAEGTMDTSRNVWAFWWAGYPRKVSQRPAQYGGDNVPQSGRSWLCASIEKEAIARGQLDRRITVNPDLAPSDIYRDYRPHYRLFVDGNGSISESDAFQFSYFESQDVQQYGAFNTEHFTMQYCFDYYELTGDMWALDEIKISAQVCKLMFRDLPRTTDSYYFQSMTPGSCLL